MNAGVIPWIGGAALVGCAVFFAEPWRTAMTVGVMLAYPLLDRYWRIPAPATRRMRHLAWLLASALLLLLLVWRPQHLGFAISTLLFAALPEEWFFRAYFMTRLGSGWRANLLATLLFATLHGMTRGVTTAALVTLPSLAYGWLFQRTRDLPLLVLVHCLSNVIYILLLAFLPHQG